MNPVILQLLQWFQSAAHGKPNHNLQRSNSDQYGVTGIRNLIVMLFSSAMTTDSADLWVEDQALKYLPYSNWGTEYQNSLQIQSHAKGAYLF